MWDLVPQPGIEPRPPALGVWSLTHWTTKEVPEGALLLCFVVVVKRISGEVDILRYTFLHLNIRWLISMMLICFVLWHLVRRDRDDLPTSSPCASWLLETLELKIWRPGCFHVSISQVLSLLFFPTTSPLLNLSSSSFCLKPFRLSKHSLDRYLESSKADKMYTMSVKSKR